MNNKTIIEFGFCIIWRIMEISEGVIRLGLRPRWITPSSISIILHKILSLIHLLLNIIKQFQLVNIGQPDYTHTFVASRKSSSFSDNRPWNLCIIPNNESKQNCPNLARSSGSKQYEQRILWKNALPSTLWLVQLQATRLSYSYPEKWTLNWWKSYPLHAKY